jgi:hypothetical protein
MKAEKEHAIDEPEEGRGDLVETSGSPRAVCRTRKKHHQDHERGDGEAVELAVPLSTS